MAVDDVRLIEDSAARTEDLIELARIAAQDSAGGAWRYSAGADNSLWWGGPSTPRPEIPAYSLDTTTILPTARPLYRADEDMSVEFVQAFEDAFAKFHADMQDGLASYIGTWFPDTVASAVDNWIGQTILNGGQGIPAAIEALIWQRARQRESEEALKLEQEAVEQFASRGFTLPTGALASRLLRVQQDSFSKRTTASREIALQTFNAYREDVKFAVDTGNKLRQSVLGAISGFIQAWSIPQGNAVEIAKAKVDSKSRMVNTAAEYYRAIVSEAELSLKAHEINRTSYDATNNLYTSRELDATKAAIASSTNAANIYGNMAQASVSSLVSLVNSEKQLLGSLAA